ncbi:ATP-binding protein [Roseiconus lacunae]|uniref:histidine kinase n=1 Tax=Roseiconus lacunae TaxID=2605694 RepID=A0ABT7PNB9_9BACT|nr:ATP-binding protein [Roseiconus lacunae]MDM4018014.1 ATP-binding protein [Roseiconus lacunae]
MHMNQSPPVDRVYRILVITPDQQAFEEFSIAFCEGQQVERGQVRFSLHHATEPNRSILALSELDPDVVVLDETMQYDGRQSAAEAIASEKPRVPIVVLTDQSSEFVASNVFYGNVCNFINKSKLRFEPLFAIIRDAISTGGTFATVRSSRLSVLILDADVADRTWLAAQIEQLPSLQCRPLIADSIESASKLLKRSAIDCVLINERLPGEDAAGFIGQLSTRQPFLPLIAMADSRQESLSFEAIRSGAKHHLVKANLTPELLEAAIRSAVDQKELESKIAQRDAFIYACQQKEAQWQERLELVVSSANAVIWDIDYPTGIVTVNDCFTDVFGFEVDEHTTTIASIVKLLHPEYDPSEILCGDHRPEVDLCESIVRMRCRDDSWKWIQSRGKIVERDATGKPLRAAGIFLDVTNQKENADEVLRKNEELQRFAHVTSHDLREPLRMITCFTELLREEYADQLDADAQRYIAFANDNAKRMQALINDLLEYSRFGTLNEQPTLVNLNSVLDKISNDLSIAILESNATLTIGDLPSVRCVETKMYSLLQNLIANSIKYRDPSRSLSIDVQAKCDNGFTVISVTDNGIGMEQKFESKVFEPFQRLHGREEYSGTGIGLAICKRIVNELGGRISVKAQKGLGATFSFTVPDHLIEQPSPMVPKHHQRRSARLMRV